MRTARILLFVFCVLLSSCNLPASRATNTPDYVATQVSVELTNQPTLQILNPTRTTTSISSPEPGQTMTPSSTPDATSTATTSPTDPREFLGSPNFVDTIDTGASFGLAGKSYDDDYTSIRVENGQLILISKYATGFSGWRTGGTKLKDAYIEAPIHLGDCAGMDTYGLVYRSPDFVKGYWFRLTCEGGWAFGYWDGEKYVNLKDGANDKNAILTGSNQTNRIGVMASGSDHKFYVNGQLIAEVQDLTFTESGSYGAVIAAFNTPNFTISIDQFAYWILN